MSEESEELPEPRAIGKYRDRIVNGSIIRTFIWLTAPPLLNQLVIVAYNLTDACWLSVCSDVAVAVPRQMWPIIMLFRALLNALIAASLNIVSQYVGRRAYGEASKSASRFFTLSFISGVVLSLFLFGGQRSNF